MGGGSADDDAAANDDDAADEDEDNDKEKVAGQYAYLSHPLLPKENPPFPRQSKRNPPFFRNHPPPHKEAHQALYTCEKEFWANPALAAEDMRGRLEEAYRESRDVPKRRWKMVM